MGNEQSSSGGSGGNGGNGGSGCRERTFSVSNGMDYVHQHADCKGNLHSELGNFTSEISVSSDIAKNGTTTHSIDVGEHHSIDVKTTK